MITLNVDREAPLAQRKQVARALVRDDVWAFAVVMGLLEALPNDRARRRVLDYISDFVQDQIERGE